MKPLSCPQCGLERASLQEPCPMCGYRHVGPDPQHKQVLRQYRRAAKQVSPLFPADVEGIRIVTGKTQKQQVVQRITK